MKTICLPTDLSDLSLKALPIAFDLSQKLDCHLNVVHCMKPLLYIPFKDQNIFNNVHSLCTKRILEQIKITHSQATENDFTFNVIEGTPSQTIANHCTSHDVDLVVMSTHGYSGIERLLMGSITKNMLHNSTLPILAVGPQVPENFKLSSIEYLVAPIDVYTPSEAAIDSAAGLAAALNLPLHLQNSLHEDREWSGLYAEAYGLTGISHSYDSFIKEEGQKASLILNDLSNSLQNRFKLNQVVVDINNGRPEDDIRDLAKSGKGLVVMQTQIDNGLDRILLGSVAERSLQGIESPVLLLNVRDKKGLHL